MGVCVRPSKRHRFCPSCGKHKMTFPSKEAADRFINYNHDAILAETGYAPTRSYYCESCGGWHVTSSDKASDRHVDRHGRSKRQAEHKRQSARALHVRQQLERADLFLRHAQENFAHGLTRKSGKLFREAFRCLQFTMLSECCQAQRARLFMQMSEFYDRLSQQTGFKVA